MSRESIIAEIRAEVTKLNRVLDLLGEGRTVSVQAVKTGTGKPRRKMSAAGRKRIAAAQRARWAKIRASKK